LEEADGVRYEHDEDGNLTAKVEPDGSGWRYHWNGAGMLREVERPDGKRVRFEYDPFARRTRKALFCFSEDGTESLEQETHFIWDGHTVLHELPDTADPITWYWEPGTFTPVAKEQNGTLWAIASDHLGAPTEIYDESGDLAWAMQLDVFGEASFEVGDAADCPWRWPGQYEDSEINLSYNRFRYYSSDFGGYASFDPMDLSGGIRLSGYVSDPLLWIDPQALSQNCGVIVDGGYEHYYRAMSRSDFQHFLSTGRIRGTTETFVSPTRAFSEGYDGVLVRFQMAPGTTDSLRSFPTNSRLGGSQVS
jgi:RHS repeat-associated protein